MAEKPFRVLLDVTDLYLENYKYVWINVSPCELKSISDFKKYVLRKIDLELEDVQLFVRDGLLLDEETIVVLREDDTVKIKYKNSFSNLVRDSLKESANFSRKRSRESNVSDEDTNSKRHKHDTVTLSPANGNESSFIKKKSKKEKRKKQTESSINSKNCCSTSVEKREKDKESPLNSNNCSSTLVEKRQKQVASSVKFGNCLSTLVKENHFEKKSHKKKDKNRSSITLDQTVTEINVLKTNDSFFSYNTECTSQEKNKNNTSPKNMDLNSENGIVLNNESPSGEFSLYQKEISKVVIDIDSEKLNNKNLDIDSEKLNNKNQLKKKRKRHRKRKQSSVLDISESCDDIDNFRSFSEVNGSVNRKHILYLSAHNSLESNCLNDDSKFQNPSVNTFVLKDKSTNIQSMDYPKVSTPVQLNSCSVPDWQLSIMPSTVSNLSYSKNDSVLHDKSARKNTSQSNRVIISEKQLYEGLPDLTTLPAEGNHIAYKALELDESYSPAVSDYREGIVEEINYETEEVKIRLSKEIILPGRTGKFENLEKDAVPEATVKKYDVLKWCDVISPKLLNM